MQRAVLLSLFLSFLLLSAEAKGKPAKKVGKEDLGKGKKEASGKAKGPQPSPTTTHTSTTSRLPDIYVANAETNCNGPNFAPDIQTAFQRAQSGQNVVLCPGNYTVREQTSAPIPTMDRPIHLRGGSISRRSIIIGRLVIAGGAVGSTISQVDFTSDDATGGGQPDPNNKDTNYLVYVQASKVSITNGTFTTGSRSLYGINVFPEVDGVTITQNKFYRVPAASFGVGVLFRKVEDPDKTGNDTAYARNSVFLVDNNFFNVDTAVFVITTMKNLFVTNNQAIIYASDSPFFYFSCGCTVYNVTISGNQVTSDGSAEPYFLDSDGTSAFDGVSITNNVVDLTTASNDGVLFNFALPLAKNFRVSNNTLTASTGIILNNGNTFGPAQITQNTIKITDENAPYFVSYTGASPLLDSASIYNNNFTFSVTSKSVTPSILSPQPYRVGGQSRMDGNNIHTVVV